jgi:hypothetical protein
MLVMAALGVAAALVSALFVSDHPARVPGLLPGPRAHSCALPVGEPALSAPGRS